MKNLYLLLICIAGLVLASCSNKAAFSAAEKALINESAAEIPFRVLKITNFQDSVLLRTPCNDINMADITGNPDFDLLVARLKTTLALEQGVGIAAPQVGIERNVFLFMRLDLPDTPVVVVVNPRIVNHPDATVCFERDGCLSIPDIRGNSVRYSWVEVEYYNETGMLIREKLEGHSRAGNFSAVIFQHEYDHLQGVLFIDKLCERP
ncbi:MAG: peptide deformylase [Prevotellaceae bacterium]|jgi:peptide deformylase|nr:peptide deformylase [Prevotellaceae bacterium]